MTAVSFPAALRPRNEHCIKPGATQKTGRFKALYRVVDAAYEKRSIALSSNLHPAGFDELMPKTIANATVARLLHHAHVVITNGDSIRVTQATRGKRVRPLTN
jgi:DNA replication protein DnaC